MQISRKEHTSRRLNTKTTSLATKRIVVRQKIIIITRLLSPAVSSVSTLTATSTAERCIFRSCVHPCFPRTKLLQKQTLFQSSTRLTILLT